ncbi:hypothetical protein DHW03_11615 [Pedobacter yonginense]|uniref:Glycosyl transferase family 1 n=1 Tax=Pedobacter yonginense TaxID=651869 RepID=A0A317EMU5_9SPHI|nr:glycosyltransferase [Pedobacter yonginense]PWS28190.1 hypothetical protein DHW03_11615 [Pedobacter yonginense]
MDKSIVFFTKYTSKGPSSRYRTFQYIPYYRKEYEIKTIPFFSDHYLTQLFSNKSSSLFYLFSRVLLRIFQVLFKISKKDLVVIEYELIPFFPPLLEYYLKLRGIKFILDYDDAIFHNYDKSRHQLVQKLFGKKIPTIMKIATHITTGSPYLTAYAKLYNNSVTEIPTSVSNSRYMFENEYVENDILNIGWVGSKTTSKNVIAILDAFKSLENFVPYKLSLIGFDDSLIPFLKDIKYSIIEWNESSEPIEISKFDVGIMPLEDNLFNRGKCGFKLVQYMACGIPTISTPLEANVKINRSKKNLHATTIDEWRKAFIDVSRNRSFFKQVGIENKLYFQKYYSVESNVVHYLSIFNNI